jgi:hypothetical protein
MIAYPVLVLLLQAQSFQMVQKELIPLDLLNIICYFNLRYVVGFIAFVFGSLGGTFISQMPTSLYTQLPFPLKPLSVSSLNATLLWTFLVQ